MNWFQWCTLYAVCKALGKYLSTFLTYIKKYWIKSSASNSQSNIVIECHESKQCTKRNFNFFSFIIPFKRTGSESTFNTVDLIECKQQTNNMDINNPYRYDMHLAIQHKIVWYFIVLWMYSLIWLLFCFYLAVMKYSKDSNIFRWINV